MTISKESEKRYHVVIDYGVDSVFVRAVRGMSADREIEVVPPSTLDMLFGVTIEKRIHKTAQDIQVHCDRLNEKLDKMKQACVDAESTDQPVLF